MLMTPHFLDHRMTDGGQVVSLTHRRHLVTKIFIFQFMVLIFVKWSKPQVLVRLQGLRKLKKFIHFMGSQTCELITDKVIPQQKLFLSLSYGKVNVDVGSALSDEPLGSSSLPVIFV
jgi:hypothetical protein